MHFFFNQHVGKTFDCVSISGIADKVAARVCSNIALDVHYGRAGLALDGGRPLQADEGVGVVGLITVAAEGHCGKRMLIFEEFFVTKCLSRIRSGRHVKNIG